MRVLMGFLAKNKEIFPWERGRDRHGPSIADQTPQILQQSASTLPAGDRSRALHSLTGMFRRNASRRKPPCLQSVALLNSVPTTLLGNAGLGGKVEAMTNSMLVLTYSL